MAQGLSSRNGLQLIDGVTIGDGNLDAFSRLRVSDPTSLFNTQLQYDLDPLQIETGTTGTGSPSVTHSANDRMAALSAGAGTGTAFLQSYQYSPYQPGKSQLIFLTGVVNTAVAGAVKDYGYFDAANGIIFRQNGTSGLQFVRRTSTSGAVVNNAVTQGSWNIDNLDGTGASGITFNILNAFILVIDLQFLGMGRVRIGFDIDGQVVWAHEFRNANNIAVPYMQVATLPIGALLTTTATATTATMYFKCAAVISEGGFQFEAGYSFSTLESAVTAGSATRTHLQSIRPRTTFNSLTTRSAFILESVNVLVTGAKPILWELAVGCTFSGAPTFANINTTYCTFEATTTAGVGTLSTAPIIIASGYIGASNQDVGTVGRDIAIRYPISLDRAGAVRALGTMSLLVTGIGGTSACQGNMLFREIR